MATWWAVPQTRRWGEDVRPPRTRAVGLCFRQIRKRAGPLQQGVGTTARRGGGVMVSGVSEAFRVECWKPENALGGALGRVRLYSAC